MSNNSYNLEESAVDALNPINLIKRIFLMLVFALLINLKGTIQNIDKWGQQGMGIFSFISTISTSVWEGIGISLGSIWQIIIDPALYYNTNAFGSIILSIFLLILLFLFWYQPTTFFINLIDGSRGHKTSVLLRVAVTLLVVVLASAIAFYGIGIDDDISVTTPASQLTNGTQYIQNNQTNTNSTIDYGNTSTVIDLLS